MADANGVDVRKPHHASHSGRKAVKKKAKNPHIQEMNPKQRNPKAFAIQSVAKAERRFRRTMDIQSKRYRVPSVDRTPVKPPPAVVAIVGPPQVGKTTLMQCMIKNFTKQNMSSIKGPVTLVSGKKKRVTLIECSNDINMMIDVVKIADLVLLLIDAKSGFEMETFEFLNICQVHGLPRIMGVLTHLDLFKNKKALQKTKTLIKKRYRTEIPRGEKMFYLSGLLHGEYLKNEMHNLGRFISVMKYQSTLWQKSHPYIFADRIEDITQPELLSKNSACDRTICLYGYARGGALKQNTNFHIPGCGDFLVKNIHFLPDPCPLPDKKKKRSLNEKERLIYAPMCGVGGIVYDKDAVYIELKGSHSHSQKQEESDKPGDKLMTSLSTTQHTIDEKIAATQLSLFAGAEPLTENDLASIEVSQSDYFDNRAACSVSDDESEDDDNLINEDNSDDANSDSDDDENSDDDYIIDSDDDENSDDDYIIDSDDEGGDNCSDEESDKDSDDEESDEDSDDEEDDNHDLDKSEESLLVQQIANGEEKDQPPRKRRKKVRFADGKNVSSDEKGQSSTEQDNIRSKDKNEEIGHLKWKDELIQKAANAFYKRQQETINLQRLVYGKGNRLQKTDIAESDSDNEELGGLFHVAKHEKVKNTDQNSDGFDCSRFSIEVSRDWTNEEEMDGIKDCFVTGKWAATEDAEHLLENDDEMYGDFEDYELGVSHKAEVEKNAEVEKEEPKGDDDGGEDMSNPNITNANDEKTLKEKRLEKKRKLKELFNSQFDEKEGKSYHDDLKMEADEQGELNKKEFEHMDDEIRVQYEGYRPGLYLRLEVEKMPCEFIRNFDPCYPLIAGALLNGEDKMGYIEVRLKKHRWYPKILKSRDPFIVSLGWRRFQTIPLYYITDHNGRNRHLKYTPKHLHCMASFWGPITPQKSGFLAVQSLSQVMHNFRIAAVGSIMQVNQTTEIVKKLKLIGTPFEIFRKTAFIEGMFHSPLEVAKYEGASIRTVSGIRGQIKKALRKPPGIFRATFEDKILKSDIVFLRTWIKVEVPQFSSSVCTLLLPHEEKAKWQGMKTLGQLRFERGLHAPVAQDSIYKPIERKLRQFAPLVVPKNIQKELPFKDKIIHMPKKSAGIDRVAVIREPHEREVAKVMTMLKAVHKQKCQKERRAMWIRAKAHHKEKRAEADIRYKKTQIRKKRILQRKRPNKDTNMDD